MWTIEIDISGIEEIKKSLEYIEANRYDKLVYNTSFTTVLVKDRISKGKTSDGKIMVTKSTYKMGRYSRQHGKERSRKGLRVDIVNLNFTGQLLRAFKRQQSLNSFKNQSVDIGIDPGAIHTEHGESLEDIANWNNWYFGKAIDIGNSEIDAAFKEYVDDFNTILMKDL